VVSTSLAAQPDFSVLSKVRAEVTVSASGDSPAGEAVARTVTDGPGSAARRWLRWLLPAAPKPPTSPILIRHAEVRGQNVQNRVSDWITRFAGSMAFVYVHIVWFAGWIGLSVEHYPFALLTMIVSLEAIFLSTFVLISQNRSDAKRQVIANEEWALVQEEQRQNSHLLSLSTQADEQNRSLLDLSNQILALTKEVRGFAAAAREDARDGGQSSPR
jgi:uncharacterized membrane protein